MIIKAFSEDLQKQNGEISSVYYLSLWLKNILSKTPSNNIERVVSTELSLNFNPQNEEIFYIKPKDKQGKELMNSLYNFALSYDAFLFAKWLHFKKASDFNK